MSSLAVRAARKAAAEAAERASAKAAKKTAKNLTVPRAPAVTGKAKPAEKVIAARAAQMELPKRERIKPSGQEPAIDTSREAYESTLAVVPQTDLQVARERLPRMETGANAPYPAKDRIRPVIENREAIADTLAARIEPMLGITPRYFYHTGPMYDAARRAGLSADEASDFMRSSFAPAYAGTSPRTETEQNLRNASLLQYYRAQGRPISSEIYETEGNLKGYPMLGSHYDLTNRLLSGTADINRNPKPSEFNLNAQGDLSGVTGDTHYIRGVLSALNDIEPGGVPEEFLVPGAREAYRETGQFNPALDVDDTLRSMSRKGVKAQVEYGPMADVAFGVAERLGIRPAEAQALQWFGMGEQTGLKSAQKTISDLINERIDVTAQALGITPAEAYELYVKGEIPLMAEGGVVKAPLAV
jgi:plasmid maintenance system antidote protein VapI